MYTHTHTHTHTLTHTHIQVRLYDIYYRVVSVVVNLAPMACGRQGFSTGNQICKATRSGGFRQSRRCSRDTYPESYTEYVLTYEAKQVRLYDIYFRSVSVLVKEVASDVSSGIDQEEKVCLGPFFSIYMCLSPIVLSISPIFLSISIAASLHLSLLLSYLSIYLCLSFSLSFSPSFSLSFQLSLSLFNPCYLSSSLQHVET